MLKGRENRYCCFHARAPLQMNLSIPMVPSLDSDFLGRNATSASSRYRELPASVARRSQAICAPWVRLECGLIHIAATSISRIFGIFRCPETGGAPDQQHTISLAGRWALFKITQLSRKRTERGSEFSGLLKLNIDDWEHMCRAVHKLIPPLPTFFNGEETTPRKAAHSFECQLPTVRADEEGNLHRRSQRTQIRVYDPEPGESPVLYEMGIPVVSTGDKWHVDIQQKVPLNLERDNVSPSAFESLCRPPCRSI
jgi:hypothetical protein